MKKLFWLMTLGLFLLACSGDDTTPDPNLGNDPGIDDPKDPPDNPDPPDEPLPQGFTPCEDGMAGPFACSGFDLLARLSLEDMNAAAGNDIWGWTDPETGREYALVGLDNGTAFVDITDTEALAYLGKLPTATVNSGWRDIKVYQNHAFVVSEAQGHGMQVFNLARLRDIVAPPITFQADFTYTGFGSAHNLVIAEESGYAVAVGTELYNGGPHFINIQDPMIPLDAGGYAGSGYTHDAQVVIYQGPDTEHQGKEILFGSNESQVAIIDISDKALPQLINTFDYSNLGYTHQGWLTEDHRYFIVGDEGDEILFGFPTRTMFFDLLDLDMPQLLAAYLGPTPAIDHNGYVSGNDFFLSNYTAGVRVLDVSGLESGSVQETAFFDTYPQDNDPSFNGVWSIYPYFESGKLVVGDVNSGLFVLTRSNTP